MRTVQYNLRKLITNETRYTLPVMLICVEMLVDIFITLLNVALDSGASINLSNGGGGRWEWTQT